MPTKDLHPKKTKSTPPTPRERLCQDRRFLQIFNFAVAGVSSQLEQIYDAQEGLPSHDVFGGDDQSLTEREEASLDGRRP
jgi:hypothetical protein